MHKLRIPIKELQPGDQVERSSNLLGLLTIQKIEQNPEKTHVKGGVEIFFTNGSSSVFSGDLIIYPVYRNE